MQAGEKDKLARPSRIHTMVPVNILIGMIMMIKMMPMDNCTHAIVNVIESNTVNIYRTAAISYSIPGMDHELNSYQQTKTHKKSSFIFIHFIVRCDALFTFNLAEDTSLSTQKLIKQEGHPEH